MKPKNLKEFKALIKRYESITLEEIKGIEHISDAANTLTGFNNTDICSLCNSISKNCSLCVYKSDYHYFHCVNGINKKTFDEIKNADTPTKLRNAFRARAKHMKTLI